MTMMMLNCAAAAAAAVVVSKKNVIGPSLQMFPQYAQWLCHPWYLHIGGSQPSITEPMTRMMMQFEQCPLPRLIAHSSHVYVDGLQRIYCKIVHRIESMSGSTDFVALIVAWYFSKIVSSFLLCKLQKQLSIAVAFVSSESYDGVLPIEREIYILRMNSSGTDRSNVINAIMGFSDSRRWTFSNGVPMNKELFATVNGCTEGSIRCFERREKHNHTGRSRCEAGATTTSHFQTRGVLTDFLPAIQSRNRII